MNEITFLEKAIDRKGQLFIPALLPKDIVRGEIGDCFDHCLIQALVSEGKYKYVEGFVKINGEYIYHAWLTDGEHAFDPTWKCLNQKNEEVPMVGAYYLGLILDTMLMCEFVKKTGYKGFFANSYLDLILQEKICSLSE